MKYLIVLFLSSIAVYSQDFEPTSMSFSYTIGGISYNDEELNPDLFIQDQIFTGMVWDQSNTFVDAFEFNSKQGNQLARNFLPNQSGIKSIIVGGKEGYAGDKPATEGSTIFQFEPTLHINNFGDYNINSNDPSNPVFGFGFISSSVTNTYTIDTDDNKRHYRLELRDNDFFGNNTELVLSDPKPNDKFTSVAVSITQESGMDQWEYDQSNNEWVFSINLRRVKGSSTLSDDEPVLTIEMPYNGFDESNNPIQGSITFSRTYTDLSASNTIISNYFGDMGLTVSKTHTSIVKNASTSFTITRKMIPN